MICCETFNSAIANPSMTGKRALTSTEDLRNHLIDPLALCVRRMLPNAQTTDDKGQCALLSSFLPATVYRHNNKPTAGDPHLEGSAAE
mmetsp:Transcript_2098/g.3649  ORF Transcript_2098/g.3649 Transcript_2098/m.3649 type:complete len:88 (+) Transcript_2098:480-743(+)